MINKRLNDKTKKNYAQQWVKKIAKSIKQIGSKTK